jgi:translation initiation factor IF-1
MNDTDRIELDGEVIDICNSKFKIRVNEKHIALCTLSGKIRQNDVKILIGDSVKIEVSPYDTNMGRIIYRYK